MTVVDAIAALPVYDFGLPFDTLPLRNYTSGLPTPGNLVTIPAISYISSLIFTATSDNPSIATAAVSGTNLLVNGKLPGTAKITATATDVDGAKVSTSFNVTVTDEPGSSGQYLYPSRRRRRRGRGYWRLYRARRYAKTGRDSRNRTIPGVPTYRIFSPIQPSRCTTARGR